MELTEKEIEDIIYEWVGYSDFGLNGVSDAAHAIFERMKEGVVWEKIVQLDCDPDNPKDLAGWSEEDDGDYVVYILGDHDKIEAGHEYLVTVRKIRNGEENGD